ncbi:MAG TPA: hypothetical protein VFI33_16610 [Puia sp.]|nr:hypothetical protein [Puia sp.]
MKEVETIGPDVKVRRKLLAGAGLGLLSLLSLFRTGLFRKKNPVISCAAPTEQKTIRVLSQDGQLVEVDVSKIKRLEGKISDKELQNWIRKG